MDADVEYRREEARRIKAAARERAHHTLSARHPRLELVSELVRQRNSLSATRTHHTNSDDSYHDSPTSASHATHDDLSVHSSSSRPVSMQFAQLKLEDDTNGANGVGHDADRTNIVHVENPVFWEPGPEPAPSERKRGKRGSIVEEIEELNTTGPVVGVHYSGKSRFSKHKARINADARDSAILDQNVLAAYLSDPDDDVRFDGTRKTIEDVVKLEMSRSFSLGKKKKEKTKVKGKKKTKKVARKQRVHLENVVGEIIDPKGHPARQDAHNLQMGVRYTIGYAHQRGDREVTPACFKEVVKQYFPRDGAATHTPSHNSSPFKFKDYSPNVFLKLREKFEIDDVDYLVSLTNTLPDGTNALRIMGTPGKSGSLFFFSHDMRFIVKTLPKREVALLRQILPAYYKHVMENEDTLLPRVYGLHRLKPDFGRKIRFVIMNNVFCTTREIHERFDIKGSTAGREASAHERAKGTRCVYKDLDFRSMGITLKLGPERKAALMEQIRKDVALLASLDIMDYSLLLGVHYKSRSPGTAPPELDEDGEDPSSPLTSRFIGKVGATVDVGIQSTAPDGSLLDEVYFFGIIDILMSYTARKKFESFYKGMTEGEGVSSKPPPEYANRFASFIESRVE